MKTVTLPWSALEDGLQVVMKDGYPWTVSGFSLSSITVEREGRPAMTRPLPDGEATVVLTREVQAKLDKRAAEAEGVLKAILGAEREALGNPLANPLVLPTQWWNEEDLRMHLRFMHGMYETDVKTVEGLLDMHRSSHADRDLPYYVPHVHHDKEQTP